MSVCQFLFPATAGTRYHPGPIVLCHQAQWPQGHLARFVSTSSTFFRHFWVPLGCRGCSYPSSPPPHPRLPHPILREKWLPLPDPSGPSLPRDGVLPLSPLSESWWLFNFQLTPTASPALWSFSNHSSHVAISPQGTICSFTSALWPTILSFSFISFSLGYKCPQSRNASYDASFPLLWGQARRCHPINSN